MPKGNSEFKYEINKDFNFVIEESSMGSIALRKISWNDRPEKLDLRKYTYADGQERMLKGVSMSDEAADELTCVLAEQGYGSTRRIIKGLSKREDFEDALQHYNDPEEDIDDDGSEDFYDPNQLVEAEIDEDGGADQNVA